MRGSARTWLFGAIVATIWAAGGCGGNSAPRCVPGDSKTCGVDPWGSQVCMADGTYGPCTYTTASGGNAGGGGTAGDGGKGGGSAGTHGSGGTAGATSVGGNGGSAAGTGGGAGKSASGGASGAGAIGAGGAAGGAGATGSGGAVGGAGATAAGGAGGSSASDAGVVASCDLLNQTTCLATERCTWIATSATTGHTACLTNGTAAQGGACAAGAYGEATGFDDCQRGLACALGQCQPICKTSPDSCGAKALCTNYSSVFYSNGTVAAGVCAPTCNPLTQLRDYDGAAACGSLASPSPALGCFGKSVFTCSKVVYPNNKSDVPAAGPSSGGFYNNGCAPGYLPLLPQMTGSTQTICVALCQPSPTSVGAATEVAGMAPSTCPAAGAATPHECRYWWWLENSSSSSFPDALSNAIGFCIDYTKYTGDKSGAGTAPYPSCATLSLTAHTYDATLTDAVYWGCQPYPAAP